MELNHTSDNLPVQLFGHEWATEWLVFYVHQCYTCLLKNKYIYIYIYTYIYVIIIIIIIVYNNDSIIYNFMWLIVWQKWELLCSLGL